MNHLADKRILLTRTVAQNEATASLLAEYEATPVLFPCLDIRYLNTSIQSGLKQLEQSPVQTTDVIFSSSNGVLAVAANVDSFSRVFSRYRLVAVGNKTANALKDLGCSVHLIPEEASQEGLVEAYKSQPLPTDVYFFRAEEGNDALANFFKSQHINLNLIPAYRSQCHPGDSTQIKSLMSAHQVDAVLLGSAKTAAFYVQKIDNLKLANTPIIVTMSTQVAEAADKFGLQVQVIAKKPSFKAMLDGLNQYFTEQHQKGFEHVI